MNNPFLTRLLPALLLTATVTAFAEPEPRKDVVIRRHVTKGEGPQTLQFRSLGSDPAEMEKVAYLGVETMPVDPTVAVQLNLAKGTGIVVRRVAEGSPAAGVLQPHDILTKLDDQILVNMPQLTVLVRNRQVGDEVKLTYIRGGKEITAKVKLAEREVPKLAWDAPAGGPVMSFFGHAQPGGGAGAFGFTQALPATPGLAVPGMPAAPGAETADVLRVIGGDRMHWFAQPRVHVLRRAGGAGSTVLDLAAGNFVFSDEQGTVEVNATSGKRELTVKDKDGKVTFQGPINTPEEHAQLPAEVRERIDAIGGADIGTEAGEIQIETKVFDPATKIRHELPGHEAAPAGAGLRTL